ncbi:DUF2275 domain-containing protein [Duffyella gerundensis]|uniref:DUF2275 domain-containing protein n=1 Tax=Duffyella gerundensis TaxID=1619313 RepID=UPI003FD36424
MSNSALDEDDFAGEPQQKPRRGAAILRRLPLYGGVALALAVAGLTFISLKSVSALDQRLGHVEKQQNVVYSQALARSDLTPLQDSLKAYGGELKQQQQQIAALQAAMKTAQSSPALAALQQSVGELSAARQDMQSQLSGFDAQLNALRDASQKAPHTDAPPATTAVKKAAPAKPRHAALNAARRAPFVLTGVEKRGTTSFAAVAPRGFSGLSQIRLIGEGQSVQGWTLIGAGYGQAQFRVNGRLTTVNVH